MIALCSALLKVDYPELKFFLLQRELVFYYFPFVLWFVDVTDKCVSHCNPDIDNQVLSAIMSASGRIAGTRTD